MSKRQPLQSARDIGVCENAQVFELSVARPVVGRPLLLHLDNVFEPSRREVVFVFRDGENGPLEVQAGFKTSSAPFREIAVGVQRLVVRLRRKSHVLQLEIAAGFKVVESDPDNSREILEAAKHHASKDEIEFS